MCSKIIKPIFKFFELEKETLKFLITYLEWIMNQNIFPKKRNPDKIKLEWLEKNNNIAIFTLTKKKVVGRKDKAMQEP